MVQSLWGDEFSIDDNSINVIKKAKAPKKKVEKTTEQKLKSKSVSVYEKIELIKKDVYDILGSYVNDTVVIRSYDDLINYFNKAIENGVIAVDTETNNTLDTIECKLMGLCLYTPGMKNAYVPVNHCKFSVNDSDELILLDKLENQLTERDISIQLKRLLDNNVKCIFHNATFDIEVLLSTCDVRLQAWWDTLSGAKVLDENELAGLKSQYILHINPEQSKYDIEHLFKGLPYAIFDPELFALYAATDSRMTYELQQYQQAKFELPENSGIYDLFKTIEVPILDVIVSMEMTGITVDTEYAKKMSVEYHKRSNSIQDKIDKELERLQPLINQWSLTPEANAKKKVYPAKKTKMSQEDIINKFPLIDEKGQRYKWSSKSPIEQLSSPIDLGSVTQLQILLYDILRVPVIDKSDPRGTSAEILEELSRKYEICRLLIEKRGVDILINTFIDKMPELIRPKTGRLHAKFNSYGAKTGRFSSSDPNLQNIPSHDKAIRMMFTAATRENSVLENDSCFTVKDYEEIECSDGTWKKATDFKVGDLLSTDDGDVYIKNIELRNNLIIFSV